MGCPTGIDNQLSQLLDLGAWTFVRRFWLEMPGYPNSFVLEVERSFDSALD